MLTENGPGNKEILIRLATTTSAMVRLEKIWKSREIEFNLKLRYFKYITDTLIGT